MNISEDTKERNDKEKRKLEIRRNELGMQAMRYDLWQINIEEDLVETLYRLIDVDIKLGEGELSKIARNIISALGYSLIEIEGQRTLINKRTGERAERNLVYSLLDDNTDNEKEEDTYKDTDNEEEYEGRTRYLYIPPGPRSTINDTIRLFKENGARYDKEKKRWYIKGDTDIDKFTPFLDIETPKPKKAKDKGR